MNEYHGHLMESPPVHDSATGQMPESSVEFHRHPDDAVGHAHEGLRPRDPGEVELAPEAHRALWGAQ